MVHANFTYISSYKPQKSHFCFFTTFYKKKISKICCHQFSYIVQRNVEKLNLFKSIGRRLTYTYRLKLTQPS